MLLKLKWLWVACKEDNALFSHGAECRSSSPLQWCEYGRVVNQGVHVLGHAFATLYRCVILHMRCVTFIQWTTPLLSVFRLNCIVCICIFSSCQAGWQFHFICLLDLSGALWTGEYSYWPNIHVNYYILSWTIFPNDFGDDDSCPFWLSVHHHQAKISTAYSASPKLIGILPCIRWVQTTKVINHFGFTDCFNVIIETNLTPDCPKGSKNIQTIIVYQSILVCCLVRQTLGAM